MPINPLTGFFSRVWQFVDQRAEGDKITRTDLDIALNDFAGPLNTALEGARLTAQAVALAGRGFETLADLQADVNLTYELGTPTSIAPGDVIEARAEQISYTVAPQAAVDAHVTTAGGVKLYFNTPAISPYVGKRFEDVATLLADTSLSYTVGVLGVVEAGDIITTAREGAVYEVAAAGASNHHLTTAGGVKLYEEPSVQHYTTVSALRAAPAPSANMTYRLKLGNDLYEYAFVAGSTTPEDLVGYTVINSTVTAGRYIAVNGRAEVSILQYGADRTGVEDSQPAFAAANAAGVPCFVPVGRYRLNTPFPLSSGMKFRGELAGDTSNPIGAVLVQYGQAAIAADEDLRWATVEGFSFDCLAADKSAYTVALSLRAHRDCQFKDFYFVRYNECTIVERLPRGATINTIDNLYENWHINGCLHTCVTIGQDGWGHTHQGDGVTTVIDTGLPWPELFNSSVAVFRESAQRNFAQLVLGTDYTVSYPSGNLRITLAAAAAIDQRIYIYPSQPRADAAPGKQRRPFSNNTWRKITHGFNFGHMFQDLRWVDAETYEHIRFHAAANSIIGFRANPSSSRSCEAGDFSVYSDCVMSYLGTADPATINGWSFGPGSLQMNGTGLMVDLLWTHGGVNRSIQNIDRRAVVLTGTVATTGGSNIVTGTGTAFRDELTLIGDSKDRIQIGGVLYSITSIDSDTQLTLASNAATTASGLTATRINSKNGNSYWMQWASLGTSEYNGYRGGSGTSRYGSSTEMNATVTFAAGETAVVVPHTLWRAPNQSHDKVVISPLSNLFFGGVDRTAWVSNITTTSVQVNLSAAYGGGPLNVKLVLELGALN